MIMSSETSCPASMTFFAARPSGVPAFTAARSMSPVEICGMRKRSLMKPAWVPLPAPGGPRRISLIIIPAVAGGLVPDAATLPLMNRAVKQGPCAFQVLGGVDAGERRILSQCDGDRVAVPERPQLLERFELLERRALEARIVAQEIGAIGIDADVPVAGKPLRQGLCGIPEGVPGPGHRCPAEIARHSGMVQHDFDDVGIEKLARVPDRVAGRGHGRFRSILKQRRHRTYQARLDHRLIALDIDDQTVRREAEALHDLRDPVSPGRVVASRHDDPMAVPFYGGRDVAVVRRYVYVARAAFSRPLRYSHDHGPASNIGERLSGKPAGRESRRDNGGEGHAKDSRRCLPVYSLTSSSGGSFLASSSSITGMSSRTGNARRSALQMNSACARR